MTDTDTDAARSLRAGRIGALVGLVAAIGLAVTVADGVTPGVWLTSTRGRWLAVLLGSAFFLIAGAYRLARWRLTRDPHAALAGTALVVMGGLAIPARCVTELLLPGDAGASSALAMRGIASMVAMALLLRALGGDRLRRLETPEQLLPMLMVSLAALLTPVMILEAAALDLVVWHGTAVAVVIPVLLALEWAALALVLHRAAVRAPWAGRAAPLVVTMAVSEACRAAGQVVAWWLMVAAILTAGVGWLAARSARRDLDRASESEQTRRRHLYEQLGAITGEVEDFRGWRSAVRHDAQNTCAGLRAAMSLLCEPHGTVRPEVAGKLRDAAVTELLHLESLLAGERQEAASYDVLGVLEEAVAPLRALDARIVITGQRAIARGEPGDLTLVVRELLLRTVTSAPGSDVTLVVERVGGTLRVRYVEGRPVIARLADLGEDAGLRVARHLMRRQGGDLVIVGVDERDDRSVALRLVPATPEQAAGTRPKRPAHATAGSRPVPHLVNGR